MNTKLRLLTIGALVIALSGCSSLPKTSSYREMNKVPLAINITGDRSPDFKDLDQDLYKDEIIRFLNYDRKSEVELVEPENAAVILDIDVKNYRILPERDVTTTRRETSLVQVGTDAKGAPIYKTHITLIDHTTTFTNSIANISTTFTFRDRSYNVRPQIYNSSYAWNHEDLYNDKQRLPAGPFANARLDILPHSENFLFLLSEQMLYRVSYDLHKYYKKINK